MQEPLHAAEKQTVISLAEYRQRVCPAHGEPPPPAPCPAAAPRPTAMLFIDVVARRGASLNLIEAERAIRDEIHDNEFNFQSAA
jgi:hypothetical protein